MSSKDAFRELGVRARIDEVEAARKHGDGRGANRERSFVRRGIDAVGESAYDGGAGAAERCGELVRGLLSVGGGSSRAHDRERVVGGQRSLYVEGEGGVGSFEEKRGKTGVVPENEFDAVRVKFLRSGCAIGERDAALLERVICGGKTAVFPAQQRNGAGTALS